MNHLRTPAPGPPDAGPPATRRRGRLLGSFALGLIGALVGLAGFAVLDSSGSSSSSAPTTVPRATTTTAAPTAAETSLCRHHEANEHLRLDREILLPNAIFDIHVRVACTDDGTADPS